MSGCFGRLPKRAGAILTQNGYARSPGSTLQRLEEGPMFSKNSSVISGIITTIVAAVVFGFMLDNTAVAIGFSIAVGIVVAIVLNEGTWGKG